MAGMGRKQTSSKGRAQGTLRAMSKVTGSGQLSTVRVNLANDEIAQMMSIQRMIALPKMTRKRTTSGARSSSSEL